MVKASSSKRVTDTQATEQYSEYLISNQTEVEVEIARAKTRDLLWYDPSLESQITEMATERAKIEASTEKLREFPQNDDVEKNRRARANALMDAECLYYLKLFRKDKTFYVEDLNERLKQTKDWLKISILIRADFLEALDSTVRITQEGLTAWEQLNQLTDLPNALSE